MSPNELAVYFVADIFVADMVLADMVVADIDFLCGRYGFLLWPISSCCGRYGSGRYGLWPIWSHPSRTIVTAVMYILTMLKKVFPFQVTHQFLTQKLHLNRSLPQCW